MAPPRSQDNQKTNQDLGQQNNSPHNWVLEDTNTKNYADYSVRVVAAGLSDELLKRDRHLFSSSGDIILEFSGGRQGIWKILFKSKKLQYSTMMWVVIVPNQILIHTQKYVSLNWSNHSTYPKHKDFEIDWAEPKMIDITIDEIMTRLSDFYNM